jgi:DnaJ-class molecular chaperone
MTNHYEVLGVEQNANSDEIKKAYRRLSLQYHPDRNKTSDAVGKFQKINDAHEILSDNRSRAEYNMKLKGSGGHFNKGEPEFDDINNILNAFMRGMNGTNSMPNGMPNVRLFNPNNPQGFSGMFSQQLNKPPHITCNIELTMEQSYAGGSFPIQINKRSIFNGIESEEMLTLYVSLPPGIDENEIVMLRNQGHQISEAVKGDVKVNIKIKNDSVFKRHGLDLVYNKTLTLKEALCGFTFDLKHINGKLLTFDTKASPSTIQPGTTRAIPKLGIIRETHIGNLIIIFNVSLPETISNEDKEKLCEII